MDEEDILETITKSRLNQAEPWIESKGDIFRFSELIDAQKLSTLKSRQHGQTVIKFYRGNCQSCEKISPAYEKFAEEIYKIKNLLAKDQNDPQGDYYDSKRANIITKYNIKNVDKFRELEVCSFNTAIDVDCCDLSDR